MKRSVYFILAIISIVLFSCESQRECEKLNSGSIMIHNDGVNMPDDTCNFYRGPIKLASLAKGQMSTVNDVPGGVFTLTYKVGAETIFQDLDTIVACEISHYSTERFPGFPSDKRLKKNITPLNDVLSRLNQLNIYTYEYDRKVSGAGFLPSGMHYGFMAQELKTVYPQFVQRNTNGYYHVNYQEMIPVLVQGMKEQQTEIDELRKELESIKSTIKSQAVSMK
jgi:hypothetical protein